MHSTTRRFRTSAFAVFALALAMPATGLAADEGDWGFRQSFRGYVYGGTGTPPLTATAGATCDPNPDTVRGGCDPKLAATTDVFGWTATDATYTLPSGAGTIDLQGNVTFSRPDHFFTISIIDPIVTVDTDGNAIVNVHMTVVSDFPGVPDHDARVDFGEFELTGPVEVTATTVTWHLGNGAVTNAAATALGGGFLPAGAALDPMRIVLLLDVPSSGTPISSTSLQLKDDPAKPAKRGVALGVSKEPLVVPADINPTVDGATVRVVSSTFDHSYPLAASNWKAVLKKGTVVGYKYADSKLVLGPISVVQVGVGKLKITGKGAGLGHALAAEPQNVSVVLSSGDVSLCAGVGAGSKTAYKLGKSFKGSKNAAPASCPALPSN